MLLTALDSKCIQGRLLSSTSRHEYLVDAVINALQTGANNEHSAIRGEDDAKTTSFWPALQIFVTLLDRLGFRFWNFTLSQPEDIFLVILKNKFFQLELHAEVDSHQEVSTSAVLGSESIPDPGGVEFGDSQMVYDWSSTIHSGSSSDNPKSAYREPSTKVHTAFSWIHPFVASLLEFGKVAEKPSTLSLSFAGCVLGQKPSLGDENNLWESLPSLDHSITLAVLRECRMYNQCLLSLSQLVHLLFTRERFSLMLETKDSWLPLISTATALFCSAARNPRSPRRSFVYSIGNVATTPAIPGSLTNASKVTVGILNSSVGRKSSHAAAIVTLINQCSNNTPLQLSRRRAVNNQAVSTKLNADSISFALQQVIETCLSNQDLEGPFLPFGPTSSLLVSMKREGSLHLPLKKVGNDSTICTEPVVSIKQEKEDLASFSLQGSNECEYPSALPSFGLPVSIKRESAYQGQSCTASSKDSSKLSPEFGLDLDNEESDVDASDSSSDEFPSFYEQLHELHSNRKRVGGGCPTLSKRVKRQSVKKAEPANHRSKQPRVRTAGACWSSKRTKGRSSVSSEPIVISSDSDTEPLPDVGHSLTVSLGIPTCINKASGKDPSKVADYPDSFSDDCDTPLLNANPAVFGFVGPVAAAKTDKLADLESVGGAQEKTSCQVEMAVTIHSPRDRNQGIPVLVQRADSTTSTSSPEGTGQVPASHDGTGSTSSNRRLGSTPKLVKQVSVQMEVDNSRPEQSEEAPLSNVSVFPDSQIDSNFVFEDFSSQVQHCDDCSDLEESDNAVTLAARQVSKKPCGVEASFFPADYYAPLPSDKKVADDCESSSSESDLSPRLVHSPSPVPIYQKTFKVPSIIVDGQNLSSQPSVRIKPCKLIVPKVSSNSSLQNTEPVSPYTRYRQQCDTFLHSNKCWPWFVESNPDPHAATTSLVVSVPLNILQHKPWVWKEQERVEDGAVLAMSSMVKSTTARAHPPQLNLGCADPGIALNDCLPEEGITSNADESASRGDNHSNEDPCLFDEIDVFTSSQVDVAGEVLLTTERLTLEPEFTSTVKNSSSNSDDKGPAELVVTIDNVKPVLAVVPGWADKVKPTVTKPHFAQNVNKSFDIQHAHMSVGEINIQVPPRSPLLESPKHSMASLPRPTSEPKLPIAKTLCPSSVPTSAPMLPTARRPCPSSLLTSAPKLPTVRTRTPCPSSLLTNAPMLPIARRPCPSSLPLAFATEHNKRNSPCLVQPARTSPTSPSITPPRNVTPLSEIHMQVPAPLVQNRPFTPQPKVCQKRGSFFNKFLHWDPAWFFDDSFHPHWLLEKAPQYIPDVFDSHQQYFHAFEPLILLELWDTVS